MMNVQNTHIQRVHVGIGDTVLLHATILVNTHLNICNHTHMYCMHITIQMIILIVSTLTQQKTRLACPSKAFTMNIAGGSSP